MKRKRSGDTGINKDEYVQRARIALWSSKACMLYVTGFCSDVPVGDGAVASHIGSCALISESAVKRLIVNMRHDYAK